MNDWLIKMAEQAQTDEARLHSALSDLDPEDLRHMALDSGAAEPTEHLDGLVSRMSEADLMGREMAHIHGDELEKVAILPALGALAARALPMLARAGAGLMRSGVAKEIATDVVKNKAVEGIGSALSRNRQQAQQVAAPVAAGAFKYASARRRLVERAAYMEFQKEAGVMTSIAGGLTAGSKTTGLARRGAAFMRSNPTAAAGIAGAAIGGVGGLIRDPGYDEQGNKKSRLGSMARGAAGGAAIGAAGAHFIPGVRSSIRQGGSDLNLAMKEKGLLTSRVPEMHKAHADRAAAAAAAAAKSAPAPAAAAVGHDAPTAAHAGGLAPAQPGAPAPTSMPHGTPAQGVPATGGPVAGATTPAPNGPTAAQTAASDIQDGQSGIFNRIKNVVTGKRNINVPDTIQDPGRVKIKGASAHSHLQQAVFEKRAAAVLNKLKTAGLKPPPIPVKAVAKDFQGAKSLVGGGRSAVPNMRPSLGNAQVTAMPGSGW